MENVFSTSLVSNTPWTKEENEKFESALAMFDEKSPSRWLSIAAMIPGKSVYDVKNQYMELVADVRNIEAGLVPVPGYLSSTYALEFADYPGFDAYRKKGRTYDQERKKGVPWTEDEHRRFLLGLQKHGKGDWRNISRNYVITKTPTQVASHAQKYYLRQQLSGGKADKRRPSIHDITTLHLIDTSPNESNEPPLMGKSNVFDLGSFDNSPFIAYPCNVATQSSHFVVNAGSFSPGFYVRSPQFHG